MSDRVVIDTVRADTLEGDEVILHKGSEYTLRGYVDEDDSNISFIALDVYDNEDFVDILGWD